MFQTVSIIKSPPFGGLFSRQESPKKLNQHFFRFASAWAGIFILSILIAMAGREGLSALYAIQARHEFDLWLKNPATMSFELWEKAHNNLASALAIDPNNPFLHEDLGRLLDNQAVHVKWLSAEQRAQIWKESLDHFRTALTLRPVSPYTWSNLALVKSRLGEWDEEIQLALRQAATLGPWEPEVQVSIVDAGWAGWNNWPDDLKLILEDNIVRGSKRQRETMLRLVAIHQQKNYICMNRKLHEALKPDWCG